MSILDVVVYAFAAYGAYVMLGFPPSDKITALGAKALTWIKSKFSGPSA
jgi:hypothetical protein